MFFKEIMAGNLLTREQFREGVFARDGHKCVICGKIRPRASHHIIERRLFPDGGYYLDNGASLCDVHHLQAESTELSCEEIRSKAGIKTVVLPPHFYPDERYDKWGNPILPNRLRVRGELFDDEGVQKILAPVLHLFTNRVKYPRTWHLPDSPGVMKGDRVLAYKTVDDWGDTEVVVTEKMDGENTSIYRDYVHARSIEYGYHPSRSRMKKLAAAIGHEIPEGWRVCGENLTAVHSLKYKGLMSFFLVFGIWNEKNVCLSWNETEDYCHLLGLHTVPVMYRGAASDYLTLPWAMRVHFDRMEGYVVRPADSFSYREYATRVGKWVRKDHVQSHGHWTRHKFELNDFQEKYLDKV